MVEIGSIEEMQAQLSEYREQMKQVELLLRSDPESNEHDEMYNTLKEAIDLLEDILREKIGNTNKKNTTMIANTGLSMSLLNTAVPLGRRLPASVAEQIRSAQIRAALTGSAPPQWAIGAKCEAFDAFSKEWYEAIVVRVSQEGKFVVANIRNLESLQEVPREFVRPASDGLDAYKGVDAPKRKKVEEEPIITEIPKWCQAKEGDTEKVKNKKKKLLKSYKSKIRFQKLDLEQKKKQDEWKQFVEKKGAKRKAGFFTGRKRESIFKTEDNGKVGVIGSGKGMTNYQKRSRHEFALDE